MIVTAVVEGILYIIYKILAMTAFKIKPDQKKRKLFGGIVGAVKTLIVCLIAFMPFASLIGVANVCTHEGDYGITETVQVATLSESEENNKGEGVVGSLLPKEAINVVEGLENNLLTKMCGVFGLDDALFDYYGSFKIEDEKIIVRKEIVNVYNTVDIVNQLSKANENYSFKDFNYEKISKEIETLSSSPMFDKILAETVGEIIMNYKDYSFIANSQFAKDNAEILDALSLGVKAYTEAGGDLGEYFTTDIKKLADVAIDLAEKGVIDDIFAVEDLTVEKALKVISNDTHYQTFKSNLDVLFSMNIVRDGAEEIVSKAVETLSSDLDPIGVSTDEWQDEDWNSLSSSVASIVKRYSNIADKVELEKVLDDVRILLDTEANYDISGILSEIGFLIDEVRGVNLLQTSENKPIIDKLLDKFNIPLPDEQGIIQKVFENDGTEKIEKTIMTHKELFEFISPALVKIRDKDIYNIVTTEESGETKIINLANLISEEGNNNLLSETLLPLIQVEPTRTLIGMQISNGITNNVLNLTKLSSYEEWETDLNYVSSLLITLNSKTAKDKTFLQLALNNKMNTILDNISESDVEDVIKPSFYAKSTADVKNSILSSLQSELRELTGNNSLIISADNVTFKEGDEKDQAQEFCDVLKTIIAIPETTEFKDIDKNLLADALSSMQANAYRVELASKTEIGLFKDAFISLMSKFKSEYAAEIAILESDPETLEEKIGVRNFAEENYSKIDFAELMTLLAEVNV